MYILGISAFYHDSAACIIRAGVFWKLESKLTQRQMDLARSVQEVTEDIMLKIGNHVYKETGMKKNLEFRKPQNTYWNYRTPQHLSAEDYERQF